MNTQGKNELRELLAAEYVLGTLRGGARHRFEHWLKNDGDLCALVAKWENHFVPLNETIPEQAPPARVWSAIVARIPALASVAASQRTANGWTGWINSLKFWRGLAIATTAITVLSIGMNVMRDARQETAKEATPQIAALPSVVASFNDEKTGQPLVFLMLPPAHASTQSEPTRDSVVVKVAANYALPKDASLQLWFVPEHRAEGTPEMVSFGVVDTSRDTVTIQLSQADLDTLRNAKALGLSLEPRGGSPQPTHVLGLSKWVKLSA